MPKQKGPQRPSLGLPGGALRQGLVAALYQADVFIERRQWARAREVLDALADAHPQSTEVFARMMHVSGAQNDVQAYLLAADRMIRLTPDDPDLVLALGDAYALNLRPALAMRQYQQFLKRWPSRADAPAVRRKADELLAAIQGAPVEMGIAGEADWLDLMAMHEEVQIHTERGNLAESIAVGERLLKRTPNLAPLLNNLSLVYFSSGERPRAIELARRVLAIDGQNPHALANLTRFLFMEGQPDEADAIAAQLRALSAPLVAVAVKQAESLSFIGDDAGVLAAWRRAARAADWKHQPHATAMLCHLAAVATMRQGDLPGARRLWRQALEIEPFFDLAQQNLEDLKRPQAEQNAPWPFPFSTWVSRAEIDAMIREVQQVAGANPDAGDEALARAIERRPALLTLLPALLDRGDPGAREFAVRTASAANTPALHAALHAFALGQRGSDQLRMQAAQAALRLGSLPAGPTRFWLKGAWSELLMLGFAITGEAQPNNLPAKAHDLLRRANDALNTGDPAKSERLLKKALEIAPHDLSLQNNLAATYTYQRRTEEAGALAEQIFAQDPDYLFGRTSLAMLRINQGRIDEADALLRPLMSRRQLHYSELAAMMNAEIELELARNNLAGAKGWLDMWQGVDPENPMVAHCRARIDSARRPARGKQR